MQNEIFVAQTPDGYSLKTRTNPDQKWNDILKNGKSFDKLIDALDSLPLLFRVSAKINYGVLNPPFPLTDYEKGIINLRTELV